MAEQPVLPAVTADDRNWAAGAHLSALVAAWVALGFLGPLIVWVVKRDSNPFIAEHARAALNFQLSWLLYSVVGVLAGIFFTVASLGFAAVVLIGVAVAAGIAWLFLVVVATVKASSGEPYHYPATITFVS